jgi:hypothetical protein
MRPWSSSYRSPSCPFRHVPGARPQPLGWFRNALKLVPIWGRGVAGPLSAWQVLLGRDQALIRPHRAVPTLSHSVPEKEMRERSTSIQRAADARSVGVAGTKRTLSLRSEQGRGRDG